jgi:hypothetical protein
MITGKAKVELGTGDVIITPLVKVSLDKGCLVLQQSEIPHDIGEYLPQEGFKQEKNDIVLSFSRTESIDVMIERLQDLKSMMNGEVDVSNWTQVDYEY